MTELPICAAILAAETGLPECKAVSLVERMRRAGMTVYHARTHLVFREDVAEFLRNRAQCTHEDEEAPVERPVRDEDQGMICTPRGMGYEWWA